MLNPSTGHLLMTRIQVVLENGDSKSIKNLRKHHMVNNHVIKRLQGWSQTIYHLYKGWLQFFLVLYAVELLKVLMSFKSSMVEILG